MNIRRVGPIPEGWVERAIAVCGGEPLASSAEPLSELRVANRGRRQTRSFDGSGDRTSGQSKQKV